MIRARPLKKEVKDGWREVGPQVRLGKPVLRELSPQAGLFVCLEAHLPVASPNPMPQPRKWEQKQKIGGARVRPKSPNLSTPAITIGILFHTRGVTSLAPRILSTQPGWAGNTQYMWIEFLCINNMNERKTRTAQLCLWAPQSQRHSIWPGPPLKSLAPVGVGAGPQESRWGVGFVKYATDVFFL